MRIVATIAMMMLAGCVSASDGKPVKPQPLGDTIRFSAGPCFGFCPAYSIVVKPNGSAVLYPQKNTAVPGETRLTVTRAQYARLRQSFAPFRPLTGKSKKLGTHDDCKLIATDHPGYEIEWTREGQDKTELNFYSGCHDAKYAKLRAAIAGVPKLLDIEAMLKTTEQ